MGTFMGHVLPGSFFIVFASWWTVQTFRRYFHSLRKMSEPYRSTATFPCSCLCGKLKTWEIEGLVKIIFTTIGFTLEIYTAFMNGKFTHYGNGQHATMFFFFGLSGVVDVLVHCQLPLPRGIEYFAMTLALVVEALLFKFHLHGRQELDVLLHTFLLYAVYASIVCTLAEVRFRKNVLSTLGRIYFTFLQGTWFWQVGFILYNPIPGAQQWSQEDHNQMMLATMIFAWHMAAIFVMMTAIGVAIGCFYRIRDGTFHLNSYDSLKMHLIKKDSNGHTIVNLNDSDSDIEFEQPVSKEQS